MRKSFKAAAPLHTRPANASSTASIAAPTGKPAAPPDHLAGGLNASTTVEVIVKDPRKKKDGSFDGRVVLSPNASRATLRDESGAVLGQRAGLKDMVIAEGTTLTFGKWEAEVTGVPAARPASATPVEPALKPAAPVARAALVAPVTLPAPRAAPAAPRAAPPAARPAGLVRKPAAAKPAAAAPSEPAANAAHGGAKKAKFAAPSASAVSADDLVLNPGDATARPVVVDRQLARQLRPWQLEGLRFMWDCTTGRRRGATSALPLSGCILAHAPGCGKTLSALSLIFTMLRTGAPTGAPLVLSLIHI